MIRIALIIIIYFFYSYNINSKNTYKLNFNKYKKIKLDNIIIDSEKIIKNKNIIYYNSLIQNHNLISKKSYLIGKALLNYDNITIISDYIEIDWNKKTLIAKSNNFKKSSLLKAANKKYEYQKFFFNLKTKKWDIRNIRIESKEIVFLSKKIIHKNDKVNLFYNVILTTDNYFKEKKTLNPDFFLKINYIKYFDKKYVITGPVFLYIHKILFPIFLPFFYMPITNNKNFSFIIPQYSKNNKNFFIEKLGFFLQISNNLNIKIFNSFLLKEKYLIDLIINYKKSYLYYGNININYTIYLNKKNIKNNNYNNLKKLEIYWNHFQNKKIFNNLFFSSKINFLNKKSYYNISNSNFTLNKIFEKKSNLELKIFDIKQFFNEKKIIGNIPNLKLGINKYFPFKKEKNILLNKLYINYIFNFINEINIYNFFYKEKKNDNRIITSYYNLEVGNTFINSKYIYIYPSLIYNKFCSYDLNNNIFYYTRNSNKKKIKIKNNSNFDLKINLETKILNNFNFKKNNFLKCISYNIKPKINVKLTYKFLEQFKYNKFIKLNDIFFIEKRIVKPNLKIFFFIKNKTIFYLYKIFYNKKIYNISLINNLDLDIIYNINKNKRNISDIKFKGDFFIKKNIFFKFNGEVNPYILYKKNTKYINKKISLYYLNFNFKYILSNKYKKNIKKNYKKINNIRYENFLFDLDNYSHYYIPWNLKIGIKYSYKKNILYKYNYNAFLSIKSNIYFTPYWNLKIKSDYDLINQKIIKLNLNFERDLRSFIMNFTWTPYNINNYNTWNFIIGIKSNLFKKLRFEKKFSSKIY